MGEYSFSAFRNFLQNLKIFFRCGVIVIVIVWWFSEITVKTNTFSSEKLGKIYLLLEFSSKKLKKIGTEYLCTKVLKTLCRNFENIDFLPKYRGTKSNFHDFSGVTTHCGGDFSGEISMGGFSGGKYIGDNCSGTVFACEQLEITR